MNKGPCVGLGHTLLASGNLTGTGWLFGPLLQLLAKGKPVAVEDLAANAFEPGDGTLVEVDAGAGEAAPLAG